MTPVGNNSTVDVHAPIAVALTDVVAVDTGAYHSMALRSANTMATWGYNGYGALGDATTVDRRLPVAVANYNRGSGALYSRGTAPRATYAYDGDGLRSSKTLAGATKAFTYDVAGGLPLVLSDGDRSYVYGPGGLPLEQIDAAGNVTYFHHDQLGSTRLLTDSAGAVAGASTYDAYGNLVGRSGTAVTPLGYAGQYTDAETGFQYLRARYYDPATGQFISRDPITALTKAPYSYAATNPLNRIDPSGLCSINPFSSNDCYSSAVEHIDNYVSNNYSTIATALDYSSGVLGTAGLIADLTIVGSPVGIALGISAGGLSVDAAYIRCGYGSEEECVKSVATAGVSVVTLGIASPLSNGSRATRLASNGLGIIPGLASMIIDREKNGPSAIACLVPRRSGKK